MPDDANLPAFQGQFLIYVDGASQLRVRFDGDTVWLTQKLIAELYGVSVKTVNEHLVNIYAEAELPPDATIRNFRIVQREGTRDVSRNVEHYSLDAILAVDYRVRSARGTAFRQWATARLSELLVMGFTMDDQRLKEGRTLGTDYFDELLARIRDIRSSERMFHQKILDIYATSIDYDPRAEASYLFFQTVQNKMHWAAHGHTAAEVVAARADADQPHMGLTTWKNAPTGMFVQSEKFVEEHGGRIGDIAVFGQESNSTTRRLAMMNMAIRGIEGDLRAVYADTFRRDLHKDLKAEDVLANPQFNVSDWHRKDDSERWRPSETNS